MISMRVHDKVKTLLRKVSEDIILPRFQNLQRHDIEEKSPGELVTIADRLSEEMLSAELAKIIPEAAIVGEEAVAADPSLLERLNEDLVWIVDPIDGTTNYSEGKTPFGIIVALAQDNETIGGWLYDPVEKRLCHAFKNQGAFINGAQVKPDDSHPTRPVAALATGFMTAGQRKQVEQRAQGHYQIVDIPRCAAEQYPRLALGTNHISVFERTRSWDHAAGILFLNEAGGKAARWDSSHYRPADKGTGLLGASSPRLWDEAAELFGDIFAS